MRPVAIGSVIDDKYELVGKIGRGGMSIVWLGKDVRLGKMWAIKEVLPSEGGERGRLLRKAIVDEANFMKRLDHPAIPRIVDIIDMGTELFVVMDYVNGQSLGRLLSNRKKPFAQEDVVRWGIELCDVLSYLHAYTTSEGERHQIVYRDMKPANLVLRDDGSVRLIDFGVCWERVGGENNDGLIVGTPGYAAPEQLPATAHPTRLSPEVVIDGRVDVYSLGATLYSLVTGHVPKMSHGKDGVRTVSFVMQPIREWDPKLSEGLEHVIGRATQKDPSNRYQTIEEMRYDLEHYVQLTSEHRKKQMRKVTEFRHWVAAAATCFLCGAAFVGLSIITRATTYEACMREASIASKEAGTDGTPSDAEALYCTAIETDPTHVEPFESLLHDVYEADNVFTPDEEARWSAIFRAHEAVIRPNAGYARLCFEAGVCYLCFYGADAAASDGSAWGQAAILNASKSRAWFERVCRTCDVSWERQADGGPLSMTFEKGLQTIDDADVRAADAYLRIAEFNDIKQRAAREGRAAGDEYQRFWNALCQTVRTAPSCIEGVRIRLYLIAFEAIAADDVLGGIYRKALEDGRVDESYDEVRSLLDSVLEGVHDDGLRGFVEAPGNANVYGPIYRYIVSNEGLAYQNVVQTYENPVARTDMATQQSGREEQAWN